MNIVFVSNYFNHHQKELADYMTEWCISEGGSFHFIQTEPMEAERIQMGWGEVLLQSPYVKLYYEDEKECQKMIDAADVVIFGGTDDEKYIQYRLQNEKVIWRYSERLYKTGRYKFISPRGLRKKFFDHTRHYSKPVYLLCAGAYVAGDFRLILSYIGKKFKFGYFPACKEYDIDELLKNKSYRKTNTIQIFWAARMIDWKHPEVPIRMASKLKKDGYHFRMIMAGDGILKEKMEKYAESLDVYDNIVFIGNQNPEVVRSYMEQSDIYLATSDYQEGWGAVINEAMNSGCAVIANQAMGAAPYMIHSGENGFLYKNQKEKQLYQQLKKSMVQHELREKIARNAYKSVTEEWNAKVAAKRLYACMKAGVEGKKMPIYKSGPLSME